VRDEVDELVAAWRAQRPDLDVEPLQVLSRISRLARHLDIARRGAFAGHGLESWEFDVLSALRRQGPPFQLTPGALIRATLVTSGTMTNRIDKLAAASLVRREPDPTDKRGVLVTLTEQGADRVDSALADLLVREHALLAGLDKAEREQLADLMRTLLAPFDAELSRRVNLRVTVRPTAFHPELPGSSIAGSHIRLCLCKRGGVMKRLMSAIALSVSMIAVPAVAHASYWPAPPPPGGGGNYYLSLGDSLSVGIQPTTAGVDETTSAGYPNQLSAMLNSYGPIVRLVQLGCSGETTATILNGGICSYSGDQLTSQTGDTGNQAAAALAFLAAHKGHVRLITLDIGANDLNPCIAKGTISGIEACLPGVLATISKNLTTLVSEIKTAAPNVPFIAMNYYDPELAEWLTGSAGQTFATDSVELSDVFNNTLESVYQAYQVPVADVASAFDTSDMTQQVTLPRLGTLPKNVAEVCELTWECVAPPQGPNEHCNGQGYRVIARAFFAVLPWQLLV
jgi:DNA-binding MarR family transcriptional regulator/lysophospholipase L1-like esterase